MSSHHFSSLYVLATLTTFWVGSPAHAARILTATVELDGRVLLRTHYTDDGTPDPERVWRYLGREPGIVSDVYAPTTSPDQLQVTLSGTLVVRIRHADRLIVEATSSELTLIRTHPSSDRWFLPDGEVERVAQANGIPRPSALARSEGEGRIVAYLCGGALLAVTLIICVVWRVRVFRRHRNPSNLASADGTAYLSDSSL